MEEKNSEDEISLKELIIKLFEYLEEIRSRWVTVGLICLLTTSFFLFKHMRHVPEYNAELKFIIEGQGGFGGSLGGLLGSFGLNKEKSTNSYKILEVAKSSKLFKKVFFDGDKSTILANRIIEAYDLDQVWSDKNSEYTAFRFNSDTITTLTEKDAFKRLMFFVWGREIDDITGVVSINRDKDSGIFRISTNSLDEYLSIDITRSLYDNLKVFFETEIFEDQKKSTYVLKYKADSIQSLLNRKVYQLAKFKDRNNNILLKENTASEILLTQEIQTLGIAYTELLKTYEMADINLKDQQPLFIEIDRPFAPLMPTKSSVIMKILLGIFSGLVIASIFIVGRKMYMDVML